jgi:copper chaperone CopZ
MKSTQCEFNVKSALGELEGIRKVEIDLPGKTVAISLDPSAVTENQIVNVIQNKGYRIM